VRGGVKLSMGSESKVWVIVTCKARNAVDIYGGIPAQFILLEAQDKNRYNPIYSIVER
jgi:hypothetical protein